MVVRSGPTVNSRWSGARVVEMTCLMPNLELSFVTEPTIGSAVIRWFSHSNYSHIDIIVDGHRIGARSDKPVNGLTGVERRPIDYGTFSRDDRLLIPVDGPHELDALEWLFKQIGKPYDTTGLFASFLFDRPTPWRDESSWWCSELGMAYLEHAGIKPCRTPVNRITPNDLYLYAGAFAA